MIRAQRFDAVVSAVADRLDVPRREIFGRGRQRDVAAARQVAMALCRQTVAGSTYESVGAFFSRDHGTVMHAVDAVAARAATDQAFAAIVSELRESVAGGAVAVAVPPELLAVLAADYAHPWPGEGAGTRDHRIEIYGRLAALLKGSK